MVHSRWLYFRMLLCGAMPQPRRGPAALAVLVWAGGSAASRRGALDFTFSNSRDRS